MTIRPRTSGAASVRASKRSLRGLLLSMVGLSAARTAKPVPTGRASDRPASCKQVVADPSL